MRPHREGAFCGGSTLLWELVSRPEATLSTTNQNVRVGPPTGPVADVAESTGLTHYGHWASQVVAMLCCRSWQPAPQLHRPVGTPRTTYLRCERRNMGGQKLARG